MMFRLDGKIGVVIGGGGGIGETCSRALAQQGATVVLASRNVDKLQSIVQDINRQTASESMALSVDVTSEDSVTKLVDGVIGKFKTVDILVNAHGINIKQPSADIDFATWDLMFNTNVRGVMIPCKLFGRIMIAKEQGKIVNLSSVRGIRGAPLGNTIYGATKGAIDSLTRMLAVEWAPFHVNVNAIAPSTVETEMMLKATGPERLKISREKSLFKRLCTPEDVAAACVYLSCAESDFVTGQILYVDAGLTASDIYADMATKSK